MEPENDKKQNSDKGYGKRPMWQWILIYIVVGGLLYWLVYYFMTADSGTGGSLY